MSSVGPYEARLSPIQPVDPARRSLSMSFERSLHRDATDEQGQDGSQDDQGRQPDHKLHPATGLQALPPHALATLQQSIDGMLLDGGSANTTSALMGEIAQSVRAARRLPGDQWKLSVRVREDVLARTQIDLASQGQSIAVELRTSCETAYRSIGAALGDLQRALERAELSDVKVEVFLVSTEELS